MMSLGFSSSRFSLCIVYIFFGKDPISSEEDIYSEKATHFCEISSINVSYVVTVKSTVDISQNFVAFSEYMNFTCNTCIGATYRESLKLTDSKDEASKFCEWNYSQNSNWKAWRISQSFASDKILTIKVEKYHR